MLRHQDLYYVYDVDKLLLGGTYSNENMLVRLLADSSIGGIWCAEDDEQYCGKWRTDFYIGGHRVNALKTEFAPEYQRTRYTQAGVTINKTVFVPLTGDNTTMVYVIVEAHNASKELQTLGISSDVRFPEMGWAQYVKNPDPYQRAKRVVTEQSATLLITRTIGKENEVRVIGGGIAIAEAQFDDQSASILFQPVVLGPNESVTIPFAIAISPTGVERALMALAEIENHKECYYATQEYIDRVVIQTSQIATPDALVNRAIAWSKVNTFRQRTKYPSGYGFTNDPPQDIVVVRDVAWFVLGSDYLMPDFSADMLDLVQRHGIETGGKITEYIQCCEDPPYHYDYDLNINDDTPLFIFGVHHHFKCTKDQQFLRQFYPTVRDAAEWILKQKLGGLIYCSTEESNVWGICSWRNIIPGYTLSGAVTEINCECYQALRSMAEMAKYLGRSDDAERYAFEADALRIVINEKLRSDKTGFYLLNVDTEGKEHHDLTGDLVFPVLFNVADENTQRRVLDALYTPMFWTEHGSRTVAVGEHNYDPEFGIRLVGGIWPNLTVWVSYANRKLYPNRLLEGMQNAYRICEVDVPKKFRNLVPGEFPECLHGENFQSRGMALSPWMPPTYLWLAIEGLLGIEPTMDGITINPNLPNGWQWCAARRIPYAGHTFSMFVHDDVLYSTLHVESEMTQLNFDEDVSHKILCNGYAVCLRRDCGDVAILVASDRALQIELQIPASITGDRDITQRFALPSGGSKLITFTPQVS